MLQSINKVWHLLRCSLLTVHTVHCLVEILCFKYEFEVHLLESFRAYVYICISLRNVKRERVAPFYRKTKAAQTSFYSQMCLPSTRQRTEPVEASSIKVKQLHVKLT